MAIPITTCNYKGYIFQAGGNNFIPDNNDSERWTPTAEDIKEVELIIKASYKDYRTTYELKSLRSYKRQYLGYLNEKGERIVWINALCGNDLNDWLKNDTVIVLDGGSCYWNVRVNLMTKQVFNFGVNSKSQTSAG